MKVTTVKIEKGKQLVINDIPVFFTGTYLCGTPYKKACMIEDSKKWKAIVKVAKAYTKGEEFPHSINKFEYNGVFGKELSDLAPYKGKFVRWSGDPGVVVMECSDGKERNIPTFAIEASVLLPKDTTTNNKKILFGTPSSSD